MIFSIIGILALYYFNVPDLVDKLSFALTISSLLLAILAIFYTIISANKQDNQFSKLIETQTELKISSNEIRNASANIKNLISDVPKHFNRLDEKLDSITGKFTSLPQKALEYNVSEETTTEIVELNIDKKLIHKMVIHLQYTAMGVLYLFIKSYVKDKNINFTLFKELDLLSYEYAIGILNGLQTTGLLDFKLHDSPLSIIPIKCDQLLINEMPIILKGVIEAISDEKIKGRLSSITEKINNICA